MSLISRREALALGAATLAFTIWPAQAQSQAYIRLPESIEGLEGTLCKLFAYDCPFCFRTEQKIDTVIFPKVERAGLTIQALSLPVRGRYGELVTRFLACMQILDEKDGIRITDETSRFKKTKDSLYWAYHRQGERWAGGEEQILNEMLKASATKLKEFELLRQTPAIQSKMRQSKQAQEAVRMMGIPAYVVNGKYLMNMKSMKTIDDFYQSIIEASQLK